MQFKDLPEERKQRLRDEYREVNVYDDWYEYVYDWAKDDAAKFGLDIAYIYFSGFWSQGDGASFSGRLQFKECLDSELPDEVRDSVYAPLKETNALLNILDRDVYLAISVGCEGRYSHEGTMSFEWFDIYNDEQLEIIYTCEEKVQEALRDYARWLYRTLEEEYEYLTSDEAIDQYLNDQDYNDEGEMK